MVMSLEASLLLSGTQEISLSPTFAGTTYSEWCMLNFEPENNMIGHNYVTSRICKVSREFATYVQQLHTEMNSRQICYIPNLLSIVTYPEQ